jgi:hypothetical protein
MFKSCPQSRFRWTYVVAGFSPRLHTCPFCHSRLNLFRCRFSAEDGIFHGVVLPLAVSAGGEDVSGLEVVDQILNMRLAVFVEYDVGKPDLEDVCAMRANVTRF